MALAREVSFPEDTRIFEAGGRADRFWVIRSGAVSLTSGYSLQRVTVASLGAGDLLGWSWLFPPHEWDFGAEAFSPVRAYEFEAAAVLAVRGGHASGSRSCATSPRSSRTGWRRPEAS